MCVDKNIKVKLENSKSSVKKLEFVRVSVFVVDLRCVCVHGKLEKFLIKINHSLLGRPRAHRTLALDTT